MEKIRIWYFYGKCRYPSGRWLSTQRENRRKGAPALDEDRIAKLDAIGMDWSYAEDRLWQRGYAAAEHFRQEKGRGQTG